MDAGLFKCVNERRLAIEATHLQKKILYSYRVGTSKNEKKNYKLAAS